jgi:hypothetical protein
MTDNILSLKIILPNNQTVKIDDKKVLKVSESPDLIPFFTELMTYRIDYSTGQVETFPTIYGKVKTKKCFRQLVELRILRYSRKFYKYVLIDGVCKVVNEG